LVMMINDEGRIEARILSDHLRFVLAGNCTFTARSTRTGKRYTFKVSKPKDSQNDIRFVGLLSGPDNESDYVYVGMITPDLLFKLTRASRMTFDSEPVKAFDYIWCFLRLNEEPKNVEIWHSGRCARCGRKLTVPESIASGFGPECIGKL
jgi:hypothetical protein